MAIIRKSKDQIKMGGAAIAIRNYRGPYFATWSEFLMWGIFVQKCWTTPLTSKNPYLQPNVILGNSKKNKSYPGLAYSFKDFAKLYLKCKVSIA